MLYSGSRTLPDNADIACKQTEIDNCSRISTTTENCESKNSRMPPKKKKGGKKKKKKEDGELTTEDKYKKTLEEIQALKDHLATRKEVARRSQTISQQWRQQKETAEEDLDRFRTDQSHVSADMSRQYKTMQDEKEREIDRLERELQETRTQLTFTETELENTRAEMKRVCHEKDNTINDLISERDNLKTQCRKILDDAMDELENKIASGRAIWETKSTTILDHNKKEILAFGLYPLHY